MLETLFMMPLFLIVAFGALQVAELGMALMLANYAASSVATKGVQDPALNTPSLGPPPAIAAYGPKVDSLMVGQLQRDALVACIQKDPNGAPTADLLVAVRAKLPAWPMMGNVLSGAFGSQSYDAQPLTCPGLDNTSGFGPFNFSSQAPYYFYVTGWAKARLNYIQ